MFDYNNFTRQNKLELRNRPCVFYNPSSSEKVGILTYQEIVSIASGVEHFPDTSFLKANDEGSIGYYQATLFGRIWLTEDAFTNEINNSQSGGYETSDNRRKIIFNMERINTNDTAISFPHAGSYIDALLIEIAMPFQDIIDTHDFDVATNAYQQNVRFVWPLQNDEIISLCQKGRKMFIDEFIGKIKNKIKI